MKDSSPRSGTQNLTVSVPRALVKKVKVVAARRDTSISALVTRALEDISEQDERYQAAARRIVARMHAGYDLGRGDDSGEIRVAREALHERRPPS